MYIVGLFISTLASLIAPGQEVLVITSEESQIETMTPFQVQQLFLGKLDRLNGHIFSPLHLPQKDSIRRQFELCIYEPGFDLKNYWLTQKLLAEAEPPLTISSWSLLMITLARNPGYIGYISASQEKELSKYKLKVVLRLKVPSR